MTSGMIMGLLHLLLLALAIPKATCQLFGVAYTPFRRYGVCPSNWEIEQDLVILSKHTNRVRIYSTECMSLMNVLLQRATSSNLEVLLGVWIDNRGTDQKEIDNLLVALAQYPDAKIKGIVVGNEALYRGTMSPDQIAGRVVETRKKVHSLAEATGKDKLKEIPIFSVEVFPHPEVVAVSDAIGVNIHPFYYDHIPDNFSPEGKASIALQTTNIQLQLFTNLFPGKKIILTETGWPTESSPGEQNIGSKEVATAYAQFLSQFGASSGLEYYWFELFDSPWKKFIFPHELPSMSEFHYGIYEENRVSPKGIL